MQHPEDVADDLFTGFLYDRAANILGKLVIVLRGLSGSGKSTFAAYLRQQCNESTQLHRDGRVNIRVCSADYFFQDLGGFDASRLPEAHYECMRSFDHALGDPLVDVIVVDNTNVRPDEYQAYVERATNENCNVVTFRCLHRLEAEVLADRGHRQLSDDHIRRRFLEFDTLVYVSDSVGVFVVDPFAPPREPDRTQ